jgi:hypothetical protein
MKRAAPFLLAGLFGLGACSDLNPVDSARDALSPGGVKLNETAVDARDIVPGQIIVRFRPGAARSEIAQQHRANKKRDMLLERTEVLEVEPGQEAAIAAQLSKNPNVEFAEPDYITRIGPCEVSTACNLPDGQFFHYKWDLHNTGMVLTQATGKTDADIDWSETFDHLGGNSFAGSAVIGVLDTGIRPTHQAFAGKILGGRRFLNDGGALTNYLDDHSHGTHVAGIAAASGTAAVPGVAYGKNIKLLVGKVCNSAGSCPSSATADGIVWMADNGANVINMSLGSFGGNPDGTGLRRSRRRCATRRARTCSPSAPPATTTPSRRTATPAASATRRASRSAWRSGATGWSDTKASYSNYGPQIEISAPGGDGNALGTGNSLILAAVTPATARTTGRPHVDGHAAGGRPRRAALRHGHHRRRRDPPAPEARRRRRGSRRAGTTGTARPHQRLPRHHREEPDAAPVAGGERDLGQQGRAMTSTGRRRTTRTARRSRRTRGLRRPRLGVQHRHDGGGEHTYLRAGSYTVSLTVTDAANLTRHEDGTVVIAKSPRHLGLLRRDAPAG